MRRAAFVATAILMLAAIAAPATAITDEELYDKIKNTAQEIAFANYIWPPHIKNLLEIYKDQ